MLNDKELTILFKIVASAIAECGEPLSIPFSIILAVAQGWPRFSKFEFWGETKRTRKEIKETLDYMVEKGLLSKASVKPTAYFYGPKYIELLSVLNEKREANEKVKKLEPGTLDRFLFDVIEESDEAERVLRLKSLFNMK